MTIKHTLLAGFSAVIFAACSGGKTESTANSVEAIDVTQFTGSNAVASSATIDSMALEADFLTPEQGVSVLVGLSEIVKTEEAKAKGGVKLEYMRKYLDTYDILSGRGDEFKSAIENARRSTGVDLPAICSRYADILSDETGGGAVEG
ncbi:MAG: hypothetical protein K2G01_04245, partial [Paramuribaculum sp.]|nr:hypothetical protein [Paramuribaculum sp.]